MMSDNLDRKWLKMTDINTFSDANQITIRCVWIKKRNESEGPAKKQTSGRRNKTQKQFKD